MSKVIVDTLENTAGTFTSAIDSLGPSTGFGGVGTYTWGRPDNHTNYEPGDTTSALKPLGATGDNLPSRYAGSAYGFQGSEVFSTASGTWRSMNGSHASGTGDFAKSYSGLWVRIS